MPASCWVSSVLRQSAPLRQLALLARQGVNVVWGGNLTVLSALAVITTRIRLAMGLRRGSISYTTGGT
jgi:hypothetical protein